MNRAVLLAGVLLCAVLACAGCGGPQDPASSSASSAASSQSSASAESAAELPAGTVEEVAGSVNGSLYTNEAFNLSFEAPKGFKAVKLKSSTD